MRKKQCFFWNEDNFKCQEIESVTYFTKKVQIVVFLKKNPDLIDFSIYKKKQCFFWNEDNAR